MEPRHIYSIFIFFQHEPGPHKYGPLIFDHEPIYVETVITGRTLEEAEAIVGRFRTIIKTEDEGGPLKIKDFFKDNKKKKRLTEDHKAAISRAMKGHPVNSTTRKKISMATRGQEKPWLKGNENRAHSWIVTDPNSKSYFVFNLAKFCREHGVPQGGLWATTSHRRHYKGGWKCRKVDWL